MENKKTDNLAVRFFYLFTLFMLPMITRSCVGWLAQKNTAISYNIKGPQVYVDSTSAGKSNTQANDDFLAGYEITVWNSGSANLSDLPIQVEFEDIEGLNVTWVDTKMDPKGALTVGILSVEHDEEYLYDMVVRTLNKGAVIKFEFWVNAKVDVTMNSTAKGVKLNYVEDEEEVGKKGSDIFKTLIIVGSVVLVIIGIVLIRNIPESEASIEKHKRVYEE